MRVRPITRDDLSRVTTIANEAFVDDELFTYLCPGGKQYPEALRRSSAARHHRRMVKPGNWGIVCVGDKDNVLGYAWWVRLVPKSMPEKKKTDRWLNNNQSWPSYLESKLLAVEDKYDGTFKLNPCVDYANVASFGANLEDLMEPLDKVTPSWHLAVLAVAPEAQRRGVGSMLVEWGIERATNETKETGLQVPITLIASVFGHGLYIKKGFRIIGWPKICIEDSRWRGGAHFVWDPSDTWIKDAEDGSEAAPGKPINALWTEKVMTGSS